ncbi:hypothetical protein NKH28_30965 [Mesorhizobium sp. M1227]|uniref:hypothetical protein n=1 Tax=Mesorhizobium sp. M1227 TaxID=2957071 RepID=UPI0033365E9B
MDSTFQVFISYAKPDREAAGELYDCLSKTVLTAGSTSRKSRVGKIGILKLNAPWIDQALYSNSLVEKFSQPQRLYPTGAKNFLGQIPREVD